VDGGRRGVRESRRDSRSAVLSCVQDACKMAIRWRTHLISYSVTCHMILGYPWMHTVWPATSKPCPCPRAQHTDYDYLSPSRSQIPHVHSVAGVSSRYQSLSIPSTLSRHPYCLSRKLATERCRGRQYGTYSRSFSSFSFFLPFFLFFLCLSITCG